MIWQNTHTCKERKKRKKEAQFICTMKRNEKRCEAVPA